MAQRVSDLLTKGELAASERRIGRLIVVTMIAYTGICLLITLIAVITWGIVALD